MSHRQGRETDRARHIGKRMKNLRLRYGHTLDFVADQLRLSFQQIAKYEAGTSHITATRLTTVARFYDVPLSYFVEGFSADDLQTDTSGSRDHSDDGVDTLAHPRLQLALAREIQAVESPEVLRSLLALLRRSGDRPGAVEARG
jgi:transcriptional regulator with XRE-family HTH domain